MKLPRIALLAVAIVGCATNQPTTGAAPMRGGIDVVIENGRVIDGTGAAWFYGDVAIVGERIVAVAPQGTLRNTPAKQRIDATGMVVAPGFIDIQSGSTGSFLRGDSRVVGKVTQGVTTEIFGENSTPAPLSADMLARGTAALDPADSISRRLLPMFARPHGFAEMMREIEVRKASVNVGAFVGGGTLREYGMSLAQGKPTPPALDAMKGAAQRAMDDGAFGFATALIYPPSNFATTEELVEIGKVVKNAGGIYITHMRSEGDQFLEALDEAIAIGKNGNVPVEVYHLKASGPRNWPKMAKAIAKIDSARAAGQDVQADMYLYIAGGNNFSSCIAPKYAADGKLLDNLKNAQLRPQIKRDLYADDAGYENLCLIAGPNNVMVTGFRRPEYTKYEGKRLDEIARGLGKDWGDALIDLNIAENAQLGEILFLMSEDNVKLQLKQPWMKFGTDAGAMDPVNARGMTHPRTYGNFTRLLAKYVRDERVITLEDAIRKASSAVATRLSLHDRGVIREGMKADMIVFDEKTVRDLATFESPHQLSVGMKYVLVNGVPVISDGVHTGARPGQIVRGPGWTGGRP
jgi:N-acyl-D-amino-acid deacylase